MTNKIKYTVFTKPWKDMSLKQLGEFVKRMGFDGVEYPLREGFQVQPEEGAEGIVRLAETLKKFDLSVESIAGNVNVKKTNEGYIPDRLTKELFKGCNAANIPVIRICQPYDRDMGFFQNMEDIKDRYNAVYPLCKKYNVKLGIQNHCGFNVFTPAELYLLIKDYNPEYIAGVWDCGHNGVSGTDPVISLDMLWDRLCMVNFKAAFYRLQTGPEAKKAKWNTYWTTGRYGIGSWAKAVDYLKKRGYNKTVCMTAEYSDKENVNRYIKQDIKYIKELFKTGE